ncbi:gamma-glutamyltransferase family protein [Humitalea sp. 24SJ18S-53]|uniref:gamma-glutamyltransferase family protein n=1 Tax=Humitalea sp. 24SJ18S-53 TaxID=3422307 RepID=UPI003D6736C7
MKSMRPTLYGSRHAVSAGHYLAANAGFAILEAGGNAIDAGCCAGIALAVLHADEVNVAGVAPIMIRTGQGKVVTIAGLGHWPASFPADLFMREHGGKMPVGLLRTVVPAAPDAWITALCDYGTMSFGDVAAAAIRYAREGFAVFDYMAGQIKLYEEGYRMWPSNAAIFLPGGKVPKVGDRFLQTDLAGTLQYMVDEERAASKRGRVAGLQAARAAFYCGDIAAKIADYHAQEGGYLTRADLAGFHSRYEEPVKVRWRDFEVYTCGPWCQGPMLAQSLLMVERAGLDGLAHNSADYIHLLTEIIKAACSDREYRYGDPRFVDVGLDELLSPAHVAARVAAIDMANAMPDMPPPLGRYPGNMPMPEKGGSEATIEPDTSYCCAVDRWGNAFSATPSDGSWRSPVIPGLGIVPSARGTQSRPDPRHPSGVAPGKRPRLTPNPAMAVRDDGSVMPFGAPGGDVQVQAMLQVFLNTHHFGMDIQEAIEQPRFASFSFPNSFAPFTHLPGRLNLEDRFPKAVLEDLSGRGHDVELWPAYSRRTCSVEAILLDSRTGFLRAGADLRQPAYAVAV